MKLREKIDEAKKSLILKFNGAMLLLLPVFEILKTNLPELQQYVDPNIYKWMGVIVVTVNLLLRVYALVRS